MSHDSHLDPGLDPRLVERLHARAECDLAGSTPWPGLDRAIARDRRDRRRLAAAAAAALLFVTALGAVPTTRQQAVRVASGVADLLGLPALGRESGGRLGHDRVWLDGLTDRARAWAADEPGTWRESTTTVLWADDLAGHRRAVVGVRTPPNDTDPLERMQYVRWTGPLGASPAQMRVEGYGPSDGPDLPTVYTWPDGGGIAVLGICRACGRMDWRPGATPATSDAGWEAMTRTGPAAWTVTVRADELPQIRTVSPDRTTVGVVPPPDDGREGSFWDPDPAEAAGLARRSRLTAPIADHCLQALSRSSNVEGRRLRDAQVLEVGRVAEEETVVVLARAAGRGWLAVPMTRPDDATGCGTATSFRWAGGTLQLPDVPVGRLFAVFRNREPGPRGPEARLIVLAPEGTARVSARGVSAPVSGRTAVLLLPAGQDGVTVRATRADGSAAGAASWPPAPDSGVFELVG